MNTNYNHIDALPNLGLNCKVWAYVYPEYIYRGGYIFGADSNKIYQQFDKSENRSFLDSYREKGAGYSHVTDQDLFSKPWTIGALRHDINIYKNKELSLKSDGLKQLLCDFLAVAEKVSSVKDYKKKNTEAVKDLVLLCYKYGLVSIDDSFTIRPRLMSPQNDELESSICFGFPVAEVARYLDDLFLMFLFWKGIMGFLTPAEKDNLYSLAGYSHMDKEEFFERGERIFRSNLSGNMMFHYCRFYVDFDKKLRPNNIIVADNALEAAFAVMTYIVSLGDDAKEQKTLQQCERCGTYYLRYHNRQRFCKACADNTVRVREHRKRKKEEQNEQSK